MNWPPPICSSLFSVYGDLKVGDEIIVIWENKTASAVEDDNDNPEYKLIDYIE